MKTHETAVSKSHDWITPKWLVDELGRFFDFYLDPCACDPQPWPTAHCMIAPPEDGLLADWQGMVWLNPPYGKHQCMPWMSKLIGCMHNGGNGIALLPARVGELWFHDAVFSWANSIYFLRGRVRFCDPAGQPSGSSTIGSVLVAYGKDADAGLQDMEDKTDLGIYFKIRS